MKNKKAEKINLSTDSSPLQSLALNALDSLEVTKLPTGPVQTHAAMDFSPKEKVGSGQRLILRREKKDRGGKTVVVISGYNGNPQVLDELARKLRKQLGCGGTVEQKEIIIQGDQPAAVAAALTKMGHQVRGVTE